MSQAHPATPEHPDASTPEHPKITRPTQDPAGCHELRPTKTAAHASLPSPLCPNIMPRCRGNTRERHATGPKPGEQHIVPFAELPERAARRLYLGPLGASINPFVEIPRPEFGRFRLAAAAGRGRGPRPATPGL
jgi:hypothetical protein